MKSKTVYLCSNCGNESAKWSGRCPSCGQWNTIEEYTPPKAAKSSGPVSAAVSVPRPKRLREIQTDEALRFSTGMGELDRVLGGGAVRGSLVLVSGAPGIGKSTMLLQICAQICKGQTVLYVSGEESESQLKLRAQRLEVGSDDLFFLCETNLDTILYGAEQVKPDLLIVDSIQTLYTEDRSTSPGSVAQVKDCTIRLMQYCKSSGVTVFVVGHINKEGAIAGPKVLEHMVDCVLYFEGEEHTTYRLLRAAKNRFGSTNEIGVFEMYDKGLREVPNPSEMLLSGRPTGTPGSCVACVMEGTRPVLAEVQALVAPTTANFPRRSSNGIDYNRASMLLAVMEKRGGIRFSNADVYLNVVGGLKLDEPAADLAVVIAAVSVAKDAAVSDTLAAIGEVGLTGEIRAVSQLSQRLSEVRRLGFTQCIIPRSGTRDIKPPDGLELLRVRNIREAIAVAF
ncbi:MAG: DNA repair protein RadA [Oscillospiraceae bacterium]|nr:DNA repair protein RadA [Oscillospiraceae bacterium]